MAQSGLDCANSALRKLGEGTVTAVDGSDTSKEGLAVYAHLDPCKKALLRKGLWNFAIKRKQLIAPASFIISNVTWVSSQLVEVTHATASYSTGQYVTITSVGGATLANGTFEIQSAVGATTTRITVPLATTSALLGTYTSGGEIRLSPAYDWSVLYTLPSDCLRLIEIEDCEHLVEGGYILANQDTSLNIRYIKDVTDYTTMDVEFYECLSTFLAWTMCDHITGDDQKKRDLWTDLHGGDGKSGLLSKARFDDAVEDGIQRVQSNDWLLARGTAHGLGRVNSEAII